MAITMRKIIPLLLMVAIAFYFVADLFLPGKINAQLAGTLYLLITTILLYEVNVSLKDATERQAEAEKVQAATSLLEAFQNEWHHRETRLMKLWLTSDPFLADFNHLIQKIYGKKISYLDIKKLLIPPCDPKEALRGFNQDLMKIVYNDPASCKPIFTAYEALDRVLIVFDRLAALRKEPEAIKYVVPYEPPIRYTKDVLQAYIAITKIALIDEEHEEQRNYKKDYMFLLHNLGLSNKALIRKCVEGLKRANRLNESECEQEDRIRETCYFKDFKYLRKDFIKNGLQPLCKYLRGCPQFS